MNYNQCLYEFTGYSQETQAAKLLNGENRVAILLFVTLKSNHIYTRQSREFTL